MARLGEGLLGEVVLPVKRRLASHADPSTGIITPGAETADTILGVLQPVSAQTVERLDAGLRQRARFRLITKESLDPADHTTGKAGDIITYDSVEYVVEAINNDHRQGTNLPTVGLSGDINSLNVRRYLLTKIVVS